MNVVVYMICLMSRDLPIGTAHDNATLLSLVELARLKKAEGVSLHGNLLNGQTVSGEMSFNQATDLILDTTEEHLLHSEGFDERIRVVRG